MCVLRQRIGDHGGGDAYAGGGDSGGVLEIPLAPAAVGGGAAAVRPAGDADHVCPAGCG